MIRRSVEQLMHLIAGHDDLWVRLCVVLPEQPEEWTLSVLDMTAGEAPPNYMDLHWSYPRVILGLRIRGG